MVIAHPFLPDVVFHHPNKSIMEYIVIISILFLINRGFKKFSNYFGFHH